VQEVLDDALARLVVDHQLGDIIALRRRVLRMEAGVEVERAPFSRKTLALRAPGMTFSKR